MILFGGCFAPYCLIAAIPHTLVIAVVLSYFYFKESDTDNKKEIDKTSNITSQTEPPKRRYTKTRRPLRKPPSSGFKDAKSSNISKESFQQPENDVLKQRGDGYELYIGRKFELKGELVIYNGLIRGYEDQGADVIVLSKSTQSVHLIQCKHWKRYEFTKDHLFKIFDKLNDFSPDYQHIPPEKINHYLSNKRNQADILTAIQEGKSYSQIRKTLYLSSKQVIQNDVWPLLEGIKENIYRYKDMKVVVYAF